eukprot:COSAG04_NODE_14995_length_547_cov_1.111607_1_plen_66_part_00
MYTQDRQRRLAVLLRLGAGGGGWDRGETGAWNLPGDLGIGPCRLRCTYAAPVSDPDIEDRAFMTA